MRTTITLDPDAFKAAKAKALHENLTLGKAVSLLVMQALKEPDSVRKKRGTGAVFRSEGGLYTSEEVEAALDEE